MNKTIYMKFNKIIDLGEYIIEIEYDDLTGALELTVLDELGEIIESMMITNSDEEDNNNNFNINLN
jgi:hypothetical protein